MFFWEDHPAWAMWVTRLVVYGWPVWYLDLHTRIMEKTWFRGCLNTVTVVHRRSAVTSDPVSEAEEKSRHANNLYMAMPSKITALSQTPCPDCDCEPSMVLREDHVASRLPAAALDEGGRLCRTHRDIYNTMRAQQVCSVLQCMRLGVSGPEGKHYCATHMGQAVVPPAERPRVKFEQGPRRPKAPAVGMDNIPDNVLKALAQQMAGEGDLTEQDIANRLTDDYGGGGGLLSNALRIFHLLGSLLRPPRVRVGSGITLVLARHRHRERQLRLPATRPIVSIPPLLRS